MRRAGWLCSWKALAAPDGVDEGLLWKGPEFTRSGDGLATRAAAILTLLRETAFIVTGVQTERPECQWIHAASTRS